MLTRVRVINFQSIEDSALELGRLTVLVGPGDAGKSAFLRALRAAFLNEGDDDDIRDGTARSTVTLTFDDGMSLEWWKEKGKGGCYTLSRADGTVTEFTKTGGAVPDEIASCLGIGRIDVDATTELTPQLSDQHDQPFILWETGSKRAMILGKATRLDVIVTAQMLCRKVLEASKRTLGELTKERERIATTLGELPDYQTFSVQVAELDEQLQLARTCIAGANRARELVVKLTEVRSRATTADLSSLKEQLAATAVEVNRADYVQTRVDAIVKLRRHRTQAQNELDNNQEALTNLKRQYQTLCEEQGVCPVCNGLLDHTMCTAS